MLISIYDRFCSIDFSILNVNCSHVCIIYAKIYEKISSGGLEVSLSIFCCQAMKAAFSNDVEFATVYRRITVANSRRYTIGRYVTFESVLE